MNFRPFAEMHERITEQEAIPPKPYKPKTVPFLRP